ncbi:MAG: hypothetical protein ACTSUE_03990 [Promethearchaeota archaeon]
MAEQQTKRTKDVVLFTTLPYHIITREILDHTTLTMPESEGAFEARKIIIACAYGFFKLDRTRTIWLLYENVLYAACTDRTRHACCNPPYAHIFELPSKIARLRVFGSRFNVFRKDMFQKLVELHLKGCPTSDEFFQRQPFPNLRYLRLIECPNLTGKNWIGSPHLRVLDLTQLNKMEDLLFQRNDLRISELHISRCRNITLSNPSTSLTTSLKVISLTFIASFRETFFKNGFPNVTDLSIANCSNQITGKGWGDIPSLKAIRISQRCFSDDFFKFHTFEKLECLTLVSCPYLSGKSWRVRSLRFIKKISFIDCENMDEKNFQGLDNVKQIILMTIPLFSDDLFTKSEHKKLQDVIINNCKGITGRGWNDTNMPVLDTVVFDSRSIENSFFQVEHSYLKNVTLGSGCVSLNGKGWIPLSSVTSVIIHPSLLQKICGRTLYTSFPEATITRPQKDGDDDGEVQVMRVNQCPVQ